MQQQHCAWNGCTKFSGLIDGPQQQLTIYVVCRGNALRKDKQLKTSQYLIISQKQNLFWQ